MTRSSPIATAPARILLALGLGGALASACADTKEHQVLEPSIVGMTQNTAPFYRDAQITLYQVQIPVRLPMRSPGAEERATLKPMAPFPRTPFLKATDVTITVHFTLANLDDGPRTVELLLDPWNEFVRYRPVVQAVNDEETTPDFSGFDKYFVLGPKERVEGVITPDDTLEMAVDLATAELVIAKPPANAAGPNATESVNGLVNRAFNLQNRSSAYDPLLTPLIAQIPVVPGLTGFDLGLRTTEPGNVAVEVLVDVDDDNGDRVVPPGDDAKTFGPPGTLLSPPPPARN
jgi:hypothetical protein